MKERIAIVDGIRTPFCKAGGRFKGMQADDLGAMAVKELMAKSALPADAVDELIFGNVAQPIHAANIARVVALKAGLPVRLPAFTVQRNCASGIESITTAANKIIAGEAQTMIAGGTESMSNIPLMFGKEMTELFTRLFKAKSILQKLSALLAFRPSHLTPVIALQQGLTDPICGLIMGKTAELIAREFQISREEQDDFSMMSHQRAAAAYTQGVFADEITPIPIGPDYKEIQREDDEVRTDQDHLRESLKRLKPYFDKETGTVTVGNSCQITDGAAAVMITTECNARDRGITPLGYLRAYAYAGLEGCRMGLGPAYATALLLKKTGLAMKDFDLIELNEAFASQVIANERAFDSIAFAKEFLKQDKALGELDRKRLNVNGGAIALGHPVGATGTRLIITILKELARRKKALGLVTMCIGGGQGVALALEVAK